MRKFLLLLFSVTLMGLSTQAQIDTVFRETFDGPSGPDSVTNGSNISVPIQWNDTSYLFRSPSYSYHLKPSRTLPATGPTEVWFETDSFTTVGKPFVFLQFKHIAKLYFQNEGRIEISTDGGQNWGIIDPRYYEGSSVGTGQYPNQELFNEATYTGQNDLWQFQSTQPPNCSAVTPTSSWWVTENFDLTDTASDYTNLTGYPDVRLRFKAVINLNLQGGPAPLCSWPPETFLSGWWIDDITVTASPCELVPPEFNFNYSTGFGSNCFANPPERGLVAEPSGAFRVGSRVTDQGGYNTGVDSVSLYYSINRGPFVQSTMYLYNSTNKEFRDSIKGIGAGDTVRWYLVAEDIGCPLVNLNNSARSPDLLYFSDNALVDTATYRGFYTFWVDSALPAKCGAPDCGAYPRVIQAFPYTIDFEGPKWGASGGTNGVPTGPPDYWTNAAGGSGNPGWTVNSGSTPRSPLTGPTGGRNGTGKYVYLETQGLANDGRLETPCIDLNYAPGCLGLEFYYHMYGDDIGEFRIEIDTGSGSDINDFHKSYKVIQGEQQTSQSDPWRRGVISLEPFVGQIIRIRFRGFKGSSGINGHIALDDVRIFQPDLVDMIVTENSEPKNGYCDPGAVPVEISLVNNGCETIDTIPVAYNINNGSAVWDTVYRSLKLGDTATFTFSQLPVFPTFGNYQINTWVDVAGDTDRGNDTATGPQIIYEQPISTFPFFEDFENGNYLTQNIGNTDWVFTNGLQPAYRWQVGREFTQTRNTGPHLGHHHKGQYLYAASNGSSGNASTYFRTKCVDFSSYSTGDELAMDFYYHGYGSNINRLEIQISEGTQDLDTWTTVNAATITQGAAPQNSEFDRWELRRVDLSQYAGESIKIRFKSTRTGSGSATDFAIDEIRIFEVLPNDAGGYSIDKPGGRASLSGPKSNTQVSIVNYGFNTLQSCTINFRVTELCSGNPPVTYSQYFSGLSVGEASDLNVTLNTAGIVYPAGEYEIAVFTSGVNGATGTNADSYHWNDTIKRDVIGITTYQVPFANDFDSCDYEVYGTYPNDGLLQWELGTPGNSGGITTPRSSPNAWVTNLDGKYLVGTTEELVMPYLDGFDTIFKAELRFYQNIDFGNSSGAINPNAAGTVFYNTLGNWEVIGKDFISANLGVNWYGTCLGSPSVSLFNGQPGFITNTAPTPLCVTQGNAGNGWIYTMFPLDEFNGDSLSLLRLKFTFKSAQTMAQSSAAGGWGIDDFEIYIPPQNSASPVDVVTKSPIPFPGRQDTLIITMMNTGGKVLNEVQVDVTIDGMPLNTSPVIYNDSVTPRPWTRGETRKFTYPIPWPANQVTSGAHQICVTTSRPNDKRDNDPSDDNLCKTVNVISELDLTSVGDDEYCEDFENSAIDWFTLQSKTFTANTPWEKGTPVQFTNGAHSGNTAWMTDLDGNYSSADDGSVFSPIFIVDSGQVYQINFWHQILSEQYHDGGNIEYSLDGGVNWFTVGWADPKKPKWFSDPFVTALDQIRGGWTDSTDGWVEANHRIDFKKNAKVIFRMRFAADFDINKAGWAFDDFCFSKDTSGLGSEYTIGRDEYKMPEQVVFGYPTPNPAKESTSLNFYLPEPQDVHVTVHNVVGQLMTSFDKKYQEGQSRMSFDTDRWKSGLYLINIEYGGKAVSRKLIIAD